MPAKLTEIQVEMIVDNYIHKNLCIGEVAKAMGLSHKTVSFYLAKQGITKRPPPIRNKTSAEVTVKVIDDYKSKNYSLQERLY